MVVVEICKMFGWTYTEYLEQPTWFTDLVKEQMRIDAQKQSNESKKITSRK